MKNPRPFIERFDRSIVGGTWKQLVWITLLVILLLVVFSGIALIFDLTVFNSGDNWWEKAEGVIFHFLDPGNQYEDRSQPWWTQIFTFVVSLSGVVFLSGMLLSTLINTIERRVQRVEQGLVVYNLNKHYVIIGYGEMIINIIDEIFEKNCPNYKQEKDRRAVLAKLPRVVVMTSHNVAEVRSDIHSQIIPDVEQHIIIYAGDIESREHLEKLNFATVEEVYVLGERNEYGRDTKNIACVDVIADLRGATYDKNVLQVNVQFNRVPSYSIAQKIDIPASYLTCKGGEKPCVYFRPFNFHENWARLMWSYYSDPEDGYSPLDFEPMVGDKYVHLIIVGLNRMGRALLLEALRLCHYANYDAITGANKTKITIIDMAMGEKKPFFETQYPHIAQIEDIEIDYIDAKVESEKARSKIRRVAEDPTALLTVAICIKDPDFSMSTGLNLPEQVYYQKEYITLDGKNVTENKMRPRVLIRQELHKGLGEILNCDTKKYANVKIFGMLNKGVSYELLDDQMPMYVNDNYNILCSGDREKHSVDAYYAIKTDVESGNNSGWESWLSLSENYRWSNRYQIDMYGYYKRVFNQNNINSIADIDFKIKGDLLKSLARVEHRRWMAERTVSGWRKIDESNGEGRVEQFQVHPLITPYDKLLEKDRHKDYDPIKNVLILDKIFNDKK